MNDALQIVTECRRPTPTDQPPIISGIHPAELRQIEAVPSLTSLGTLDADRMLYSLLSGSFYSLPERLRSKRPFVQLRGIYGSNFQWTSKASALLNGQNINEIQSSAKMHPVTMLLYPWPVEIHLVC